MRALRERIDRIAAWWRVQRPARALARFGSVGGGVLTGGIAYSALFSIFAVLALGWTLFATLLGKHPVLRTQVVATLDSALPGLIDTNNGQGGLIKLEDLQLSLGVSIAGAVALVTLVLSAVSAVSALRTAVRAMLGATDRPNAVVGKLHAVAGLVGIATAVFVASVLTIALSTITDRVAAWIGHPELAGPTTRILGVVVAFVVDAATFILIVRVLAAQKPPWKDQLIGAAIAGAGLGVLRLLGASVVSGSLRHNKALAPFAVLVVLLAWVNLVARIVLMAAAWTADPPLLAPQEPQAEQMEQVVSTGEVPRAPSSESTPPADDASDEAPSSDEQRTAP